MINRPLAVSTSFAGEARVLSGVLEPTVDRSASDAQSAQDARASGRQPAREHAPQARAASDLTRVYDQSAPGLYRFILVRVGHDEHLAADIMQQVWAAAIRNAAKVPDREMEFWLRGVARNLISTHWRRTATRPVHVPVPDSGLAGDLADRLAADRLTEAELNRREVRDQLALAITELSSEDQDLIHAHYVAGRSQVQIAQDQGLSVRAVEGRLYRARAALREQLRHLTSSEFGGKVMPEGRERAV